MSLLHLTPPNRRPVCARPARTRVAFTLVELLVVIAIIGLLVSILLPAMSSARQTATQLTCLTRIRSFGQALAMYTSDNKGFYPYGQDARGYPSQLFSYPQSLLEYLGIERFSGTTAQMGAASMKWDADHEIIHDPIIWAEVGSTAPANSDLKRFGVYANNAWMMGWVGITGYDSSGNYSMFTSGFDHVNITDMEKRLGEVGGSPASNVTFADGFNPLYFTSTTTNPIFNANQQIFSAPHMAIASTRSYDPAAQPGSLLATGGRTNVYFMDGHARSVQLREFPGGGGLASWQIHP